MTSKSVGRRLERQREQSAASLGLTPEHEAWKGELYDPEKHPDNVTHHLVGGKCRHCGKPPATLPTNPTQYVCPVALEAAT